MKYSDFTTPNCPDCGRFFDTITETVLVHTAVTKCEDMEELELEASEVFWESSELHRDPSNRAELGCSHCRIHWWSDTTC